MLLLSIGMGFFWAKLDGYWKGEVNFEQVWKMAGKVVEAWRLFIVQNSHLGSQLVLAGVFGDGVEGPYSW